MKQIPLTQGKFALVDDADFDWLSQWTWTASRGRTTTWYARRSPGILMHRQILGEPAGREVDHENLDGLDNQRINLRIATRGQNQHNRGRYRSNTSGYIGVSWRESHQKWRARINVNGEQEHLGYFDTAEAAANAYDEAARRLHGFFARTNRLEGLL